MIIALIVITQILGVLSAGHAVMSTRTPQGAIAWAVSLLAMPYVAVPAYWVFGRNKFNGYVRARHESLESLDELIRSANNEVTNLASNNPSVYQGITTAEQLARIPMTQSNEVELLIDGQATFDSIFEGIESAVKYVLVQFYIVKNDDLGRKLKLTLIDMAARGVEVYFLFDEIGSLGLSQAYIDELRQAGVNISPFHTRKGSGNRFQLNFRNHRKTVVVDGKSAWIGGHNVGNEYLGLDPEVGHWRDTHMRVSGPAAIGAQLAFVEDWRWATDGMVHGLNWDAKPFNRGRAHALVIASGPADPLETASLMYIQAISSAKERVWIASPYFVPDDAVTQALQLAALRGVDVRILIPEKSDNLLVTFAAYSFFNEIASTGVEFYRYQYGFLHQKVMLVDDAIAAVGTANFDNRSFRLNFEITCLVVDPDFSAQVLQMFEQDFSQSRRMEIGEFDEKAYWFKLVVRLARLAAPVL